MLHLTPPLQSLLFKEAKRNDSFNQPAYGTGKTWTELHDSTTPKGANYLGKWMARAFKRRGYSILQKTISQKIPNTWHADAQACVVEVRKNINSRKITIMLNADQTFINFFPGAKDGIAAPTGSKRIGSAVQEDEKAGATLMVTIDSKGKVLPPFWVFNGKTCLCADLEAHNSGDCRVQLDAPDSAMRTHFNVFQSQCSFQHKHWFDKYITLRYLKWLKLYFEREISQGHVIGLLWDHAPAHSHQFVKDYLAANDGWLVVMMIPGGLTSIMQPCDLVVNKELKALVKRWYSEWRLTELARLDAEGHVGHVKLKMPRIDMMDAMVGIVGKINQDGKQMKSIVDCFLKCGFSLTQAVPNDVLEEGGEWLERLPEFKAWLASLSAKSLYKHLLESLNFADGDDGLVEELAPSQLDLALATTDDTGFDAHLAEALGEEEMSDHCSSSSEEDDNNEAIS